MAYKLSVKAEEDIVRAYREGFRLFGAEQAEKYYAGLERVFQFLSDSPEAARERTEIAYKLIKAEEDIVTACKGSSLPIAHHCLLD